MGRVSCFKETGLGVSSLSCVLLVGDFRWPRGRLSLLMVAEMDLDVAWRVRGCVTLEVCTTPELTTTEQADATLTTFPPPTGEEYTPHSGETQLFPSQGDENNNT